jgi:haloacetate dehalogenase
MTGLFPGFRFERVDVGDVELRVRHGGSGPPVLLLHGHPQTHAMWHLVAPQLSTEFTVVAPDLRGYGQSSKPQTDDRHEPYSKRALARDAVELMRRLGFERFSVVGHDRGGRVAYRLALDHPDSLERLALLDIVPTSEVWRRLDRPGLLDFWHWTFLAQPAPLPERLLAGDPDAYYFHTGRELFHPEALADYLEAVHDQETRHAMCEDYRAGASIDVEHDEADRAAGRRIRCPVLVLWAAHYGPGDWCDVLEVWRDWAGDVRGRAVDCGHYLAEERPDEVAAELVRFLQP